MHSCIVQACCIYCYTITSIAQGKRKAAADPLNDMMMYVKANNSIFICFSILLTIFIHQVRQQTNFLFKLLLFSFLLSNVLWICFISTNLHVQTTSILLYIRDFKLYVIHPGLAKASEIYNALMVTVAIISATIVTSSSTIIGFQLLQDVIYQAPR